MLEERRLWELEVNSILHRRLEVNPPHRTGLSVSVWSKETPMYVLFFSRMFNGYPQQLMQANTLNLVA